MTHVEGSSDVCILCGEEGKALGPPPHVHLSCVLKAQPKSDYPDVFHAFARGHTARTYRSHHFKTGVSPL